MPEVIEPARLSASSEVIAKVRAKMIMTVSEFRTQMTKGLPLFSMDWKECKAPIWEEK